MKHGISLSMGISGGPIPLTLQDSKLGSCFSPIPLIVALASLFFSRFSMLFLVFTIVWRRENKEKVAVPVLHVFELIVPKTSWTLFRMVRE